MRDRHRVQLSRRQIIFRQHPAIPFLLLLAIADDALGLVILALFYPAGELRRSSPPCSCSAALGVSFLLRRNRVRNFWPYILAGGALSWIALFQGGLHPALALVPIVPFLPHAARDAGLFVDAPASARDPLNQFEHWWRLPVQAILFLFGLVNAGVQLGAAGAGTGAVLVGLLAGKPLGIGLAVAVAVGAGLQLPRVSAGARSWSLAPRPASGSPSRCSSRPRHSRQGRSSIKRSSARCSA